MPATADTVTCAVCRRAVPDGQPSVKLAGLVLHLACALRRRRAQRVGAASSNDRVRRGA